MSANPDRSSPKPGVCGIVCFAGHVRDASRLIGFEDTFREADLG